MTSLNAFQFLGTNIQRFSICNDNSGQTCTDIATNKNFQVVKNDDNTYSATPKFIAIDVSPFMTAKKFPVCDPTPKTATVFNS